MEHNWTTFYDQVQAQFFLHFYLTILSCNLNPVAPIQFRGKQPLQTELFNMRQLHT